MDDRGSPRRPLKVEWDIEIIEGGEGALLARQQKKVMLEVLEWIAEHRDERNGPAGQGAD